MILSDLGSFIDLPILAYIFLGFGALADALIVRFRLEYGKRMSVLLTGGFSRQIAPYMDTHVKVDSYHTLKSLVTIYQDAIKSKRV